MGMIANCMDHIRAMDASLRAATVARYARDDQAERAARDDYYGAGLDATYGSEQSEEAMTDQSDPADWVLADLTAPERRGDFIKASQAKQERYAASRRVRNGDQRGTMSGSSGVVRDSINKDE